MNVRQIKKSSLDFTEVMNIAQDAIMSRLNCHNIGKIIEFDASTQTCTVQLMILKQFYNEIITPAPITNVPLIIYGAGGAYITPPNPVGSICLLLFLDRNSDNFLKTGEQYTPETTRTHDFSDCVALTTFSTLNSPIENYDSEAITVIHNKIINDILYSAVIKNYAESILLKRIQGGETPIFSQIELTDKINISNSTTSLLTLLIGFIDIIKSITIMNNAVSPTSQAALDNYKTNFGNLLK